MTVAGGGGVVAGGGVGGCFGPITREKKRESWEILVKNEHMMQHIYLIWRVWFYELFIIIVYASYF